MPTEQVIELFRPSSGTMGESFHARFCHRCERDRRYRETEEDPCEILGRTFFYDIDQPEYPREWRYDSDGDPTCTAFVLSGEELPPIPCEKTDDMFTLENTK